VRKLYKFHWDCGRMGDVDGVFIAESEDVDAAVEGGAKIYFGEILGKHSEISGTLEGKDLTALSDDQAFIDQLVAVFGGAWTICGYSPLDYVADVSEDD
jgi:hypothetical protein